MIFDHSRIVQICLMQLHMRALVHQRTSIRWSMWGVSISIASFLFPFEGPCNPLKFKVSDAALESRSWFKVKFSFRKEIPGLDLNEKEVRPSELKLKGDFASFKIAPILQSTLRAHLHSLRRQRFLTRSCFYCVRHVVYRDIARPIYLLIWIL